MEEYSDLCQIDKLNLSCFGCCTIAATYIKYNKREIYNILKNNQNPEFKKSFEGMSAVERPDYYLCERLRLMEDGKKVICIDHPAVNNGEDKRECFEMQSLCLTAIAYEGFDEEKKKRFIDFLKSKKLDSVEYSRLMLEDKLIEMFEKYLWKAAKNQANNVL